MTNETRPTLPQAANAAMEAELKEGKAYGLMTDTFQEAITLRYGYYATGLEEREALRRIDGVMRDYFQAKANPHMALEFVAPKRLRELIETLSVAKTPELPEGNHEPDSVS